MPNEDSSHGESIIRSKEIRAEAARKLKMCEISEGFVKEGKIEGKLESIRNLMDTMHWSAGQAMVMLKVPEEEHKMYNELLRLTGVLV